MEKSLPLRFHIPFTAVAAALIAVAVFARETIPMQPLPQPDTSGTLPLETAISKRRSVRDFTHDPISLADLGQLLWACQGITASDGRRSAPSAGALYPLEIYVVADRVQDLEPGLYHYVPGYGSTRHFLEIIRPGVRGTDLSAAALDQESIRDAAVNIVITGVVSRTRAKYRGRAERYVFLEAGHAAQNVCLQAQTLNLGAVTVGAFHDDRVVTLIEREGAPLYILAIGRPR